MATEAPAGAFLQIFNTGQLERNTGPDKNMALYVATGEGDDNWTVYELRWDPLDYMPVARRASGDSTVNRFQFYAVLDSIWTVGEELQLAERGHDDLPWKSHGAIRALVFDRAAFCQGVPGLLMQPPLPPLATQ